MTETNGHYKHDLAETLAAQTVLLEQVRDHLKSMPNNLELMTKEIKELVKEMHVLNESVRIMTDPRDGYVALIAGKRQVPILTHTMTVAALAVCLVAAILALTNSDMSYGDFSIGKKKNAVEVDTP